MNNDANKATQNEMHQNWWRSNFQMKLVHEQKVASSISQGEVKVQGKPMLTTENIWVMQ